MLKRIINSLSLILESAKKEKKLIFKDDAVVEIYIVFVVLVYFFYTFVYSPEIFSKLPVAVVDNDQTTITQKIKRMLNDTESLDVTYEATSLEDGKRLFEEQKVSGIILIPKGFSEKLQKSGGNPTIAVYSDASYMLYYDKTLLAVTNTLGTFTGELQLKQTMMSGVPMKQAVASSKPFNVIANPLYNLEEGYAIFIIPLVLIVALQTLQLTGMGVLYGTLRETNTFVYHFSMARRRFGFIFLTIGRAIPYLVISALLLILGIKVVFHIFTIPQRGDFLEVMVFLIPVILAITFLGMVLMNVFRNREDTIMICTVFSIPALMMGGVSYPIVAFPLWIKVLGFFFPSTIGVKGFLALTQAGASLSEIHDIYLQMWIICLFYFILALWTNWRFLYNKVPSVALALIPETSQEIMVQPQTIENALPAIQEEKNTLIQAQSTVEKEPINSSVTENNSTLKNSESNYQTIYDFLKPYESKVQGFDREIEALSQRLTSKLTHLSINNLQSPPSYLAIPALTAMKITSDLKVFNNIYANLIANAMDKNAVGSVLPDFVNIIKKLTPDEIQFLSIIAVRGNIPYVNITQRTTHNHELPKYDLENLVFLTDAELSLITFSDNLALYAENLLRLGILSLSTHSKSTGREDLKLDENIITRNAMEDMEKSGIDYEVSYLQFSTTVYGKGFIQAVIKNK